MCEGEKEGEGVKGGLLVTLQANTHTDYIILT